MDRKGHGDDDDAADAKRRAIADSITGLPTKPQIEDDQLSNSDDECDRLNKLVYDNEDGGNVINFYSNIGDFTIGKFEVYEDANGDTTKPLNELLANNFIPGSESYLRALDLIKKELLSAEKKMAQAKYDGRGKKIHTEIEFAENGNIIWVFVDDHKC